MLVEERRIIMGKIYTVVLQLKYDIYEPRMFNTYEFIQRDIQCNWDKPIFAETELEAIEKYKKRYDVKACPVDPWKADHGIFDSMEYHNVEREIVVASQSNNYTFDELKKHMNSQDFMDYCRQELIGYGEVIK
jgi:hypothetical protein